ncbi:PKD domain-containing protein [Candidatus Methanodesulfokora washburnensis]|uniref:PKD domain-containing protein n=1 Tax=Candidatus Methanodesulfokora washburnensis TaxID=2478471 RepID=UPI00192A1A70|nr:PKD domain-containing protein [Candidatus Methanodesulfokores washburnensis]
MRYHRVAMLIIILILCTTTAHAVTAQYWVKITGVEAPSTFVVGKTITVRLDIQYSLPANSHIYIMILKIHPGSQSTVWTNSDVGIPRSGSESITYQASFQVPSEPGYTEYEIIAMYQTTPSDWWNKWIQSDVQTFSVFISRPPSLTLYNPKITGLNVSMDGIANPGWSIVTITRIHCNWGDGIEEDIHFPASHVYEKPGTYVITVTAYQSDGLTDNETVKVTVPLQESQPSSSPSQPSSSPSQPSSSPSQPSSSPSQPSSSPSQPSSSPSQPSSEAKPASSGIWIWLGLATVVFIIIMSVWIIGVIRDREEEKLLEELLSK